MDSGGRRSDRTSAPAGRTERGDAAPVPGKQTLTMGLASAAPAVPAAPAAQREASASPVLEARGGAAAVAAPAPASSGQGREAAQVAEYRARLQRPGYAYLKSHAEPLVAKLAGGTGPGDDRARAAARLAALFTVSHSADGGGETEAKRASNAYHAELGARAIEELERIATGPGDHGPGERWDAMTALARKLERDHDELLEDGVALTIGLGSRDQAERGGGVNAQLRIAPNFFELLVMLALMEHLLLPPQVGGPARGRTALDRRGRVAADADANRVLATANGAFAGAARAALGANVQIADANVPDGGAAHRLTAADATTFVVRLMACPLGDRVVRPMINPSKSDVIQISDRAADSDIGRGMAQALGEIVTLRRALAHNALPAGEDALRRDALVQAPQHAIVFSAHDQGAIAQLAQMLSRIRLNGGNTPEQRRLRMDLMLLIDALGIRGADAGPRARRTAVEARLVELGAPRTWLVVLAQPEARLSEGLQRTTFEARLEEASEERTARREQIHDEPLHRPALQGARRTLDEARQLAAIAGVRRTLKSTQTVAKYRAAELDARPGFHRVRDPQIGGGAALANVRPGQLLVDSRGRWQQDRSVALAQTAALLRWVMDAGIGDPFEFVANPNDRVPLPAVSYWLDTLAMQADVIDGSATMEVDHQSRFLIRVTPNAGGGPISLEVSGQPVVASGFPREQVPIGRVNLPQVVQQLIAGLANQVGAGVPQFLARLQGLDQRNDRAVADVMQNVGQPTLDAINLLAAPVPAALASLQGAATATGGWLAQRAQNPTRVLTGDEANAQATLNPDAAAHWLIAGTGGTGISAAEIILDRSAHAARVTMVGGRPTAGLLDNDQFRRVWRVHGPGGNNRFQVLANQDVDGIATPDLGVNYTVGRTPRGDQHLDQPPLVPGQPVVGANQRWLVAAQANLLPAVERILTVQQTTTVVLYGAALPLAVQNAALFQRLITEYGPAGGLRLQVLSGAYAANAQAAAAGGGFALTGPVQGQGYIAALGRANQLSPILHQLILEARTRGPNNVRGELLHDADRQYIGYRIIIIAPDASEKRTDVTGAASRFPPEDVFTQQQRDTVAGEIRRQDAPVESGNFDGGFVATALQSVRYGRNRRAEVEAQQVRDYRLGGRVGELTLLEAQRPQWAGQVAEFLARELRIERARLQVTALGGGATGDPLFKVSVGEAELGVFKVFRDQAQAQTELTELGFLAGLHLQRSQAVGGVVGTQPVAVDADNGRRGILMRTAPGRSVDQMVTSLPAVGSPTRAVAVAQLVASSQLVARALAEIHRLTNTGNRMLDQGQKTGAGSDAQYIRAKIMADANPRAAAVRAALDADRDAVVARLDLRIQEMGAANLPASAYHGDANAGNFIVDGGNVNVIDVGNMRWSHAGADGNKTGINDVAKYLGSLETLHPAAANRLQPAELAQIAAAFVPAYLLEFNQGGRNVTQADLTPGIAVFKVEQLIAAFHGHTIDGPTFRNRVKGVLGL